MVLWTIFGLWRPVCQAVRQLSFYEVRILAPRSTPKLDGRVINYSLLFGIVTAAVPQWLKLCHVVK